MKRFVALLLCFALLTPVLSGALGEGEAPEVDPAQETAPTPAPTPEPTPEPNPEPGSGSNPGQNPAPSPEQPKLRLRYSVDEDNALIVRGTFYLGTPNAPGGVPDGAEYGVAVLNGEGEQVARKTATVTGGRFTVRFEGLYGAYAEVRVYGGERTIGRIRGPIRVGAAPETGSGQASEQASERASERTSEQAPESSPGRRPASEQRVIASGGTPGNNVPRADREGADQGTNDSSNESSDESAGRGRPESEGGRPGRGESGPRGESSGRGRPEPEGEGSGENTSDSNGVQPGDEEPGDEEPGDGEPGDDGPDDEGGGMVSVRAMLGLFGLMDEGADADGDGEPLAFLAAGLFAFALNPLQFTASQQGNSFTIAYTVTGDAGVEAQVRLAQGSTQIAQATVMLPTTTSPTGMSSVTGNFTVPGFGVYDLTAWYTSDTPGAPVQVTVEPLLLLDAVSDASPVVVGRTGANLQVEVTTFANGTYTTVRTQSNFRGAFYAAMPRLHRAGSDVWVTAFYPGGRVTRHVLVQRARDLPTYPNNLAFGQYGSGVLAMQQRLLELGYDVEVNALFDAKTLKAVLDFQRINFIAQDGIGGPVTRALLFSVTAREFTTDPVGSAGVLKYGDEGPAVKALQTALRALGYYHGSISGRFGDGTRSAVRAFERRNGLPVDGIADLVMQALLFSGVARRAESGSGSGSSSRPSSGTSNKTVAGSTFEPEPFPTVQPTANEIPITANMAFGTYDTVATKVLARGTLRVEAESAYPLLDARIPGMLLRASYVDESGKAIPCRIRWIAPEGDFMTRDDQRAVIVQHDSPYTGYGGEVYWSLTPFFEAARRGASAPLPTIGQDNMIFWLDKPLMSAQPGRQWRVTVQALDLYDDGLWLESAELVMSLGEDGVVTLYTDALWAEGWDVSTLSPEAI